MAASLAGGGAAFVAARQTYLARIVQRKTRELDESETKYRAFFENSMDAILLTRPDGSILEANPAACKLFERTEEELKSLGRGGIVDTSDPRFSPLLAERLKSGRASGELFFLKRDGTPFPAEIASAVFQDGSGRMSASIIIRDITERKQAEKRAGETQKELTGLLETAERSRRALLSLAEDQKRAAEQLKESVQRYSNLIEYSPDAIFVNAENRLILVNQACIKLFGAEKAEDLLGKSPFDLFHPDYHEIVRERIRVLRDLGSPVDLIEEKILRLDGTSVDVETVAAPFRFGETNAIHVIIRDITARKKIEQEIRELNADLEKRVRDRTFELERANREMEAFTYSVSHDLRAPLRAIEGFSRFLQEDYEKVLDEEGNRLLNIIRTNALKMDRLITDLLNLSRITRIEFNYSRIDMNTLAESVYRETTSEEERRRFEFTLHPLPEAWGDATLIRQVWYNLISNAVKYSMKSETKKIEIGSYTEAEKNTPVYFVKDRGAGFDPKYAGKLFGVFQRLHSPEEFEGTGVGLAIVQRIIVRHRGKVWAEGRPNEGAAFYFTLPHVSS